MKMNEEYIDLRVCEKIAIEHSLTNENIHITLIGFHEGKAFFQIKHEETSAFRVKKIEHP